MHPTLITLLLALASPAPGQPAQAALPSVAVFRVNPEFGVPQGVANLMGDRIATLLRDSGAFGRVVSSADLESMVDLERQKQMANCPDEGCVAELAGVLGVDFLVSGSMGKLGGSYLVNLKLIDVRKSVTASAVSERLAGESEEALLDGSLPAVRLLLDKAQMQHRLAQEQAPLVTSTPRPSRSAQTSPVVAEGAPSRPGWVFPVLGAGVALILAGGLLLVAAVAGGAATSAFIAVNTAVFVDYPVDLGKGAQRSAALYVVYGVLGGASIILALVGLGVTALGGLGAVVAALKV